VESVYNLRIEMATYSSFKKIDSAAIIDTEIQSADIAATTVTEDNIDDLAVTAGKMSGTVTSGKLNNTLNLSSKTVTYRTILAGDISNTAAIAAAKVTSTAVTDNLGYLPINPAGDTMTGSLYVAGGSSNAPSMRTSNSANTGINFSSGAIDIVNNGNIAVRVGGNSGITMPNKPAFGVSATRGWLYSNSFGGNGTYECGNIMSWNNASYQTGGTGWNTNGRYTAPVTGYYYFQTTWYFLNDNNQTQNYIHAWIARSGTVAWSPGSRIPYTINMHGNRNQYDDGSNYSAVMQLTTSDYASCWIRWHNSSNTPGSTPGRLHAGHQIFSGHLIG